MDANINNGISPMDGLMHVLYKWTTTLKMDIKKFKATEKV